jgi:hypothetical protein
MAKGKDGLVGERIGGEDTVDETGRGCCWGSCGDGVGDMCWEGYDCHAWFWLDSWTCAEGDIDTNTAAYAWIWWTIC